MLKIKDFTVTSITDGRNCYISKNILYYRNSVDSEYSTLTIPGFHSEWTVPYNYKQYVFQDDYSYIVYEVDAHTGEWGSGNIDWKDFRLGRISKTTLEYKDILTNTSSNPGNGFIPKFYTNGSVSFIGGDTVYKSVYGRSDKYRLETTDNGATYTLTKLTTWSAEKFETVIQPDLRNFKIIVDNAGNMYKLSNKILYNTSNEELASGIWGYANGWWLFEVDSKLYVSGEILGADRTEVQFTPLDENATIYGSSNIRSFKYINGYYILQNSYRYGNTTTNRLALGLTPDDFVLHNGTDYIYSVPVDSYYSFENDPNIYTFTYSKRISVEVYDDEPDIPIESDEITATNIDDFDYIYLKLDQIRRKL